MSSLIVDVRNLVRAVSFGACVSSFVLAGGARAGDEAPMRGVMMGTNGSLSDLTSSIRRLGEWDTSLVRWQLVTSPSDWCDPGCNPSGDPFRPLPEGCTATAVNGMTRKQYRDWLECQLTRLEQLLPVFQEEGIRVLIDMHHPPGGWYETGPRKKEARLFYEKPWRRAWLRSWVKIVRRFTDESGNPHPVIWGYDLLNEPAIERSVDGRARWRRAARKVVRRIREYDAVTKIIVEPVLGLPREMAPGRLRPIPNIGNAAYGPHFYLPMKFTGQRIGEGNDDVLHYPSEIAGTYWDRCKLREKLRPTRRFQDRYGVEIFIGEFGAPRWAPDGSAFNWLCDVMALIEEQRWSATFHAFREANVWSVEHGPDIDDPNPSPTTTDRAFLLVSWLNRRSDAAAPLHGCSSQVQCR